MRGTYSFTCRWLLIPAIYVGGWYSLSPTFQLFQLAAVALILFAGFLALLSGKTLPIAITNPEFILGFAFVFGMLVALMRGAIVSSLYGAVFLLVLTSISLITRYFDEVAIDTVFRRVYLAIIASIFLLQPDEYLKSVTGTVERAIGLVRFAPLGMQTNLAGLVYGGGSLLFLKYYFISDGQIKKLGNLAISIFCLSMVFAASARASLLALTIVGGIAFILIARRGSKSARITLGALALILPVVVFFLNDVIVNFLTTILDLDSKTRGLDSGGSGRVEIWRNGVTLVFSDPLQMFFGLGVRGAEPNVIGFPVESSYINLALEHGVVISSLIILTFFATVWRVLRRVTKGNELDYSSLLDCLMLLFILLQSIFNRYLIAIGNPYSLLVLFLLLRLNLSKQVPTKVLASSAPKKPNASRLLR